MNYEVKAEEFFKIMVELGTSLGNIPQSCRQGELGALLYLNSINKNITPTELSEAMMISLPRTVSLLKSLENKGLINKNINLIDKRKTIINITEQGKQLILEKKDEAINNIVKIIEKLDEDEIIEYIRLTKKIGKIIIDTKE